MQIFQLTKKNFAIVGVDRQYSFNARILTCTLIFITIITLDILYMLYVADNFLEITFSVQTLSFHVVALSIFMMNVISMPKIFEFFDITNHIVNQRKCIQLREISNLSKFYSIKMYWAWHFRSQTSEFESNF